MNTIIDIADLANIVDLDDDSPLAQALQRIKEQAAADDEETVCGFSNFV